MDRSMLAAMSIRWTLSKYPSGSSKQQINIEGLRRTFQDESFELEVVGLLRTSLFSLTKPKKPTQQHIDDIINHLSHKISYINAWPELKACFHLIQAADALSQDNIFHENLLDTADEVLVDRVSELFD